MKKPGGTDASATMKHGDPVTIVRGACLMFMTVHTMGQASVRIGEPIQLDAIIVTNKRTAVRRWLSDEGITWIRGHHDHTSDEGKALLAAFAVVTEQ